MLVRRVVVAAAAALLLAGCTGNGGSSSSESVIAEESVAVVDVAGSQLTMTGFASVELGKALPAEYTFEPETECKGQVLLDASGNPTVEVWTAESGEVSTIIAGTVATDKGVKVGDAVDAVASAYPDAAAETVTGVEAQVVRGETSALVFEAAEGVITYISLQPLAGLHAVGPTACQ